jgi:hypothetical protein
LTTNEINNMEEIGPYGLHKSNPNEWIKFDCFNWWNWPNANWLLMEFVHVDECHSHLLVNSIMSFTFIHVIHMVKKFQVINMCLFLYLHITISSLRFIFIHVITFHAHGKLHMFGWFHANFLHVIKFHMYGEHEG